MINRVLDSARFPPGQTRPLSSSTATGYRHHRFFACHHSTTPPLHCSIFPSTRQILFACSIPPTNQNRFVAPRSQTAGGYAPSVASRHPPFSTKTGPQGILKQALKNCWLEYPTSVTRSVEVLPGRVQSMRVGLREDIQQHPESRQRHH